MTEFSDADAIRSTCTTCTDPKDVPIFWQLDSTRNQGTPCWEHSLSFVVPPHAPTSATTPYEWGNEPPTTPGPIVILGVTVVGYDPLEVEVEFEHEDTGNAPIENYRVDVNGAGNHGASPMQTASPVTITDDGGNRNLVIGANTVAMGCINLGGFVGPYSDAFAFEIPEEGS